MMFLGILTIDLFMNGKKGLRMGIKMNMNPNKQKQILEEFKDLAKILRKG